MRSNLNTKQEESRNERTVGSPVLNTNRPKGVPAITLDEFQKWGKKASDEIVTTLNRRTSKTP